MGNPVSEGGKKAYRFLSIGLACQIGAITLFIVAWAILYFVEAADAELHLVAVVVYFAYLSSALPIGPAILFVIGSCLIVYGAVVAWLERRFPRISDSIDRAPPNSSI